MSRLKIIVRVSLILASGIVAWIFGSSQYWLVSVWFVLFFVFGTGELLYYLGRTRRELANFLVSIRQNDFSTRYPEKYTESNYLNNAFQQITDSFRSIRSEKESNYMLLQSVLEHSGVPMLAFMEKTERITLINNAMKKLLERPHLTQLSGIGTVNQKLLGLIRQLEVGEKVMEKLTIGGKTYYYTITLRKIVLIEDSYVVLAMHNINSELDQKELESWQKLIRVITHEIKNSVIPIATLSQIINEMVSSADSLHQLDDEAEEDLRVGLKTIEKRSKGLVKFVSDYGSLAKVPKPVLAAVNLAEIVNDVTRLEEAFLKSKGITMQTAISKSPIVKVDREMITQVLINLIKNAGEALGEKAQQNPLINIRLHSKDGRAIIAIEDNGPGISSSELSQVFVPFYTTKKQGSGIGLSYSRQIMLAHKGFLRAQSTVGEGTIFEVGF